MFKFAADKSQPPLRPFELAAIAKSLATAASGDRLLSPMSPIRRLTSTYLENVRSEAITNLLESAIYSLDEIERRVLVCAVALGPVFSVDALGHFVSGTPDPAQRRKQFRPPHTAVVDSRRHLTQGTGRWPSRTRCRPGPDSVNFMPSLSSCV